MLHIDCTLTAPVHCISSHSQASLEEQSKQRGRQLSRHLSDVAPEVAGRLRQQRSESVRCSAEGVTYFPAADPAEGGGDCGLVLPSFGGYPPSVRAAVLGQLCNSYLQNEAEQVGGLIGGWVGAVAVERRRWQTLSPRLPALLCCQAPPSTRPS